MVSTNTIVLLFFAVLTFHIMSVQATILGKGIKSVLRDLKIVLKQIPIVAFFSPIFGPIIGLLQAVLGIL
ncbi:unnamed protein product [Ceutorhynchus assimilis]|uniref:Uncharacterized protein n=1 Tax=Ceutorhynchus assimilis TaxID=467358 RepID=A0A9N9MQ99_9CUCU|nr:unnamed protein product [Ceutorhynchus assimilis]